jgi:predicted ester cyclase
VVLGAESPRPLLETWSVVVTPVPCHRGRMAVHALPVDVTSTELLGWVFERINAHDVASLRAFWTDDTVEYFPDATCHGADEVAGYLSDKFASIEGFHLEVVAVAESGDDVHVHWRMTGRHTGMLLGLAGTGKSIAIDGMDHFVLRDGRALTNTIVFDQMAFARQVGLLPPDRSAVDKALKAAFNTKTKAVGALRRSRSPN